MRGITHMMMLGTDEGHGHDRNDIMDMILKWSDKYVSKMKRTTSCDDKSGHKKHR
jgi:hypothetical protein